MATSKDQPTTSKTKAAAKAATPTYAEQAAALAVDTRALVEGMREDLDKLADQIAEVNQTEPTAQEGSVADGVRRIPMAVGEVTRALAALDHAAADLARTATTG